MRKTLIVMGCTLGLGMALLPGMPAAAQSTATGATKKAPAAQTTKAPAATTKPATATKAGAAKPAQKPASALTLKDQKDKISYAVGMSMGSNIRKQEIDVNVDIVTQALRDAAAGGKLLMTEDEMRAAIGQLQNDMRAKQEEKRKQMADNNKKEAEAFLAANKTKAGVVALPSGLQYRIITPGTGPKPTATDTVVCNYKGTLINGTEFDSSYKRGAPATFPVGGVIKGWTEALQLMPVGSKWELVIPADLAYADRGAGPDIGPGATLVFEVELISIKSKDEPKEAPKEAPKPQDPKK